MDTGEQPIHNPEIERRGRVERPEDFSIRAEHVLDHYLADHPESELRKMVGEGIITKERAFRTLMQQARDPKTGVQRPDVLPYVMEYEMYLRREKDWPFTIGVYDIDDFKRINSELDHTGGDEVLRRGAEIMARTAREDDVTRWGGEEFVIGYSNASVEQAQVPAERLRASFEEELINLRPDQQRITISGGLIEYDPARHPDWKSILKEASQAVMAAKAAGKNRIISTPEAEAA